LRREIDNSSAIIGVFNIPFSERSRIVRQKIKKEKDL
jgi:hypothetical protein